MASARPIWRVGFPAVFTAPTIAAADGALAPAGACAYTEALAAARAMIKAVLRIERRSMIKLRKFVKALYGAFLSGHSYPMQNAPRVFIHSRGLTRGAAV